MSNLTKTPSPTNPLKRGSGSLVDQDDVRSSASSQPREALGGGSYRSLPTAFPANSSLRRMYRPSVASDACPVCALIFQVGIPAIAALVTNPARREWPE